MPLTVLVLVHLILGEVKLNKETRVREQRGWESVHKRLITLITINTNTDPNRCHYE